jgi:tRNA pseudouridine55 synthase
MGNWPIHTFTQWADFQEGQVLLIDKPLEWTSFDVVNKVRHLIRRGGGFKKIKVGHAGTLDPLATGVLVLCTGRMTKRIAELSAEDKAYQGHMTFGSTTESLDLESTPIPGGSTEALDLANLREAAVEFTGAIEQLPPIFSAKKVGGRRAYRAARKGEDIALSPVSVNVHRFDVTDWSDPIMSFDVLCSKGTYIRALARDMGKSTGAGAHLSSLCRTASGDFPLSECWSLDTFEARLNALPAPVQAQAKDNRASNAEDA